LAWMAVQHVILAQLKRATADDPDAVEALNTAVIQALNGAAGSSCSNASAGLGDAEHDGVKYSWGAAVRFATPAAAAAFQASTPSGTNSRTSSTSTSSISKKSAAPTPTRAALGVLMAAHLAPGTALHEFNVAVSPSVASAGSSLLAAGLSLVESAAVCVATAGVVAKLVSRL